MTDANKTTYGEDRPAIAVEIERLVEAGLSRSEAFTIVRDRQNAENGVTSIGYPRPDSDTMPVTDQERVTWQRERAGLTTQIALLERVCTALKQALSPAYLTEDDIEQLVERAVKGPK